MSSEERDTGIAQPAAATPDPAQGQQQQASNGSAETERAASLPVEPSTSQSTSRSLQQPEVKVYKPPSTAGPSSTSPVLTCDACNPSPTALVSFSVQFHSPFAALPPRLPHPTAFHRRIRAHSCHLALLRSRRSQTISSRTENCVRARDLWSEWTGRAVDDEGDAREGGCEVWEDEEDLGYGEWLRAGVGSTKELGASHSHSLTPPFARLLSLPAILAGPYPYPLFRPNATRVHLPVHQHPFPNLHLRPILPLVRTRFQTVHALPNPAQTRFGREGSQVERQDGGRVGIGTGGGVEC